MIHVRTDHPSSATRARQVSPSGLLELLSSGGTKQARALRSPGSDAESSIDDTEPLLTREDFEETRRRALAAVSVPADVLNLVADLRAFLQDKCEPPVYVSDRRLVKAVALMQVRAPACHLGLAPAC